MISWPDIIFHPDWMRRLDRMAGRRFPDPVTAEEASTFILDQLSHNNWQRCDSFNGSSQPETWLFSVAANLLEEFARKRFGRARPPAWLQQQGELWVTIWHFLCLERHMAESIIDRLSHDGSREPNLLHNIIRTIRARLPWCGASHTPIPTEFITEDGSTVNLLDQHLHSPAPLEAMTADLREQVLATLHVLAGLDDTSAPLSDSLAGLAALRQQLQLEDDERLLLKLHFQEGLSGQAIARLLGVPNHQPGRQIRRLLDRIRHAFHEQGLLPELLDMPGGESA